MTDTNLRLSVQRAMAGEVPANLAAIRSSIQDKVIVLEAFFFIDASDADIEHFREIGTLVIADYPAPYNIDERFALISETDVRGSFWDFLRAEATYEYVAANTERIGL